ncbi:N-acetylmuramoyl-L-alanine amidase [uncultured Cohaesibacter sp.]|uniref:peptidoglycan recognition protein family protein n=1 Tax=uncultured Cohaesibacter sp. TaxID=1002546 RepID=UPI002AA7804A|nr:N-acetylmuramoyl-L-alanine amidase [uncultured Cohaesibacter sp.]
MVNVTRAELGAMLNLRVDLIPATHPNRSGRNIAPRYITIHNTANSNPGANAAAHARFVRNTGYYLLASGKKNYVSWHYTVDDKEVIKHLPVNERAIHAGRGNGVSIAIEICMHADNDQSACDLRAQRLVAVLMHDLKIPASHVVPHKHWTNKNCPTLLLDNFSAFVAGAEAIRAAIMEVDPTIEGLPMPSDIVTESEIRASLDPAQQKEAQPDIPPEDDPEREHEWIAKAVEAFISEE